MPGTKNIHWAINVDGTFKAAEDLKKLYADKGVTPDKEVVTYCRIGERSSHSWFVLKYLLGYPNVRNNDGSWMEWGNLVRTPLEKRERKRIEAFTRVSWPQPRRSPPRTSL